MRIAGLPLHVVQRGHDRGACFFGEDDYRFYLHHLAGLSRRFDCPVHAYVLMTNHVHLLLTPASEDGATLLIKHLGQRYVQYINRLYNRRGTLWEGRFRSGFVDSCEYFFKCQRYIELNPVRARLVQRPADYPWSSYSANAEGGNSPIVQPHPEYLALGATPGERGAAYREHFATLLEPDDVAAIRRAGAGGRAYGGAAFRAAISAMQRRRVA